MPSNLARSWKASRASSSVILTYCTRPLSFQVEALLAGFAADHRLEVTHDHGERVRPDDRPDDVVRVLDAAHPIAHRLVRCVLQRLAAAGHLDHIGPHQLHAEDVERLS